MIDPGATSQDDARWLTPWLGLSDAASQRYIPRMGHPSGARERRPASLRKPVRPDPEVNGPALTLGAPTGGCPEEIRAWRLACTQGDGVAREAFVEHVDRIPLTFILSSIVLLAGTALEIPAEPTQFASICRSRSDGSATKALRAPAAPGPMRLETTKAAS